MLTPFFISSAYGEYEIHGEDIYANAHEGRGHINIETMISLYASVKVYI